MAEIGKVTPGSSIIQRVPRDHPATDDKEHQQETDEKNESRENEEDEKNEDGNDGDDRGGGIDLYV